MPLNTPPQANQSQNTPWQVDFEALIFFKKGHTREKDFEITLLYLKLY